MSSPLPKRQSLSTIESSVTRLLVATKKLLEGLTQWSKHEATENDVSDHYVDLGNEFKVACRAFSNAGVDVSDLGDVPHSLRLVLEEALCEEPSQESLDKFLPVIRDIIVNLLQNLKKKQATVKQLQQQNTRSVSGPSTIPIRSSSSSSTFSPSIPTISEPQTASKDLHRNSPTPQSPLSTNGNTLASVTTTPQKQQQQLQQQRRESKDALSQLQNGDSLRRRASKRFSAYQYAKLANFTPERDSDLPMRISSLESRGDRTPSKGSPLISNGFLDPQQQQQQQQQQFNNQEKAGEQDNHDTDESINVYLKIGQKVKKVQLSGSLTTASLRLLFVEKFAYSPGGSSFPDLYIQDPNSNVSYELENLGDIKDETVISLHEVESTASTVGWKDLEPKINTLTTQVADLQKTLATALKDISLNSKIESQPQLLKSATPDITKKVASQGTKFSDTELKELEEIKRDLSVIRRVNLDNKTSFTESVNLMLAKVKDFKETGYNVSESSNRSYMKSCRTKLSKDCEGLLTKTDDLQDVIEALRKDVAQRRVRPPKKQLTFVAKELQVSKQQLELVNEYITDGKHNWKRIWESELNTVCEEQQFFNLQEELVMDLKDDLERAFETFQLVEECTEQLSKNPNAKIFPNLPLPGPNENLNDIRDALLSEVVALNPNHEGRLAAIERAERLRDLQREISLADNFQEELGGFVEGNMLKKSGGIEEMERLRELQNRENLGFLD